MPSMAPQENQEIRFDKGPSWPKAVIEYLIFEEISMSAMLPKAALRVVRL